MMASTLVLVLLLLGGSVFYFGARYFSDKATDKDGFYFGLVLSGCVNMLVNIAISA